MIEDKKTAKIMQAQIIQNQIAYEKKSKQILDKTLGFSGLKMPTEINYRAVKIRQKDHLHEIYTINTQCQEQLPHIVMLHGFGGTGMTYVKLFKTLRYHYNVHALDGFGIGHSSRGQFKTNFTYQEARDYFIDAIEDWRKAVNIEKFTLAGHSFGGYLATCYFQKYSQNVDRLILLSPVGTSQKTPEQVQQQLKTRYQKGLSSRIFMFLAQKIYNWGVSPSKIMGNWIVGQKLISRVVDHRLKLVDEQNLSWKQYFRELSRLEQSSQRAFYIMFKWPLIPKHTIEGILLKMQFTTNIEFYYGQYDWMDKEGAKRLAGSYDKISYQIINNADHQLIFDNPDEVCHYIILKKFNQEEQSMNS